MRAVVLPECLGLSVIFEDNILCDFRGRIAECVCTERSCWCSIARWDDGAKARLCSYGEEYRRCVVKPLVLFLSPLPMVFLSPALSSSWHQPHHNLLQCCSSVHIHISPLCTLSSLPLSSKAKAHACAFPLCPAHRCHWQMLTQTEHFGNGFTPFFMFPNHMSRINLYFVLTAVCGNLTWYSTGEPGTWRGFLSAFVVKKNVSDPDLKQGVTQLKTN